MPPAATATRNVANPHAKAAQNAADMGRQSQHRVSNQHKRKCKLAQPTRKPEPGDQLALDNRVAFAPERDCKVCKARHIRKFILPTCTIPKRAHHPNCSLNKTTHGLGNLTVQSIANMEDNKRFKALTAPIRPEERFSGKHATSANAAAFFQPKEIPKIPKTTQFAAVIVQQSTLATTSFQCLNGSNQPKRGSKSQIQSGSSPPLWSWGLTKT